MNEKQAEALANLIGGEPWQSGGGIWLVIKYTEGGRVVTISDEVVKEYMDEAAFEEDRALSSILVA